MVLESEKTGHDWADGYADKGAAAPLAQVAGTRQVEGDRGNRVVVSKWMQARHRRYEELMARIHKTIALVLVAETVEREKRRMIHKQVHGYDEHEEAWCTCRLPRGIGGGGLDKVQVETAAGRGA